MTDKVSLWLKIKKFPCDILNAFHKIWHSHQFKVVYVYPKVLTGQQSVILSQIHTYPGFSEQVKLRGRIILSYLTLCQPAIKMYGMKMSDSWVNPMHSLESTVNPGYNELPIQRTSGYKKKPSGWAPPGRIQVKPRPLQRIPGYNEPFARVQKGPLYPGFTVFICCGEGNALSAVLPF